MGKIWACRLSPRTSVLDYDDDDYHVIEVIKDLDITHVESFVV